MLKAVIFDMDGLMIDSERVTYEGYVKECDKYGYTMDLAFYRQVLGLPLKPVYQMFYNHFGNDFPMDEIIKDVHQYMADLFKEKGVPIKKGLVELLEYLKEHGYKTMVATSSNRDRVDVILKDSGIEKYFDDSICGDEIAKGKPHPDVFLKACEKLGVLPEEALVLEDSEAGIQAAYDGHIKVICVPDMKYPRQEYQKKTYAIVDSLEDVTQIIKTQKL